MKAVAHTSKEIDSLKDIELPVPSPSGRDVLVKVEAVSVNPVDYKVRKTDTQAPRVLGFDAAGTVHAVGDQVSLFSVGDPVYYAGDNSRPGSNSQFQLVDERIVGRKPKSLDFAQAAAIPLTAITAWEAFFDRLKVAPHRTMLIIGGAGGVGSIGIQIAKQAQLKVIATASRPETIAWCKELGADHTISHRQPMRPQLEALGLKHVDYIANFSEVDEHWAAIGDLIAPQGGIVMIVGNKNPLNVDAVRLKSAAIHFELMFTRPRFKTPDMIEQHRLLNQVADWLDAGRLRGTMKQCLAPINAANLRQAHRQIESGSTIGKLVLKGW
ncbi:MAG TPA: zinc-binding alcohol dehydrogenase family protein [Burkholderiales bacterium]